ncbi:MAG: class I SAM-dependent methyltransferase [Candidatus Anstonellaceae archaeon]
MNKIESLDIGGEKILIKTNDEVYFPAEDSYLILRNLKKIKGEVLEIGTGSGIISIYLAKKDKKNNIKKLWATDINKAALEVAFINAKLNGVERKIRFYYSDLFKNIKKQKFDFIIFNPPYLPTEKEDKIKGRINLALDGGEDGLRVIEKFLRDAKKFLKKSGKVYLVVSDLADLEKFLKIVKKYNYRAKKIAKEAFFFERIILYKISLDKRYGKNKSNICRTRTGDQSWA